MPSPPASRRRVLAVGSCLLLGGCSTLQLDDSTSDDGHSDSRDIHEIIATNLRDEPVELAVSVDLEGEDSQFSAVYSLDSDEYDSSYEVRDAPRTVSAFTRDGQSREWDYGSPSSMNCQALDVEIAVREDGLVLNKPC